MTQHIRRSVLTLTAITVLGLSVAGCASTHAATDPSPSPSATPVSYPVPTGCPSAKDLGKSWDNQPSRFTAIDASLLTGEVAKPLPDGGCAYLDGTVKTSSSSSATYREVAVWYFNVGASGKQNPRELAAWATSAGGTAAVSTDPATNKQTTDPTGLDFDLPESFSGWTNSRLNQVDGTDTSWGWNPKIIPAYTQGAQARIDFAIDSAKADAIVKASAAGGVQDPTKMLGQGLAANFTATVNITDTQGYTARVTVHGSVQPWTKDVTDAPPGQMNALSSASVGGTVANTTAQRNTKTTAVSVVALYPEGSPACNNMGGGVSTKNADWSASSYCGISLGAVGEAALAPGDTQDFPAQSQDLKLGAFAEASDALAQLNTPASIYLYFGGDGPYLTNASWHADQGCLSQTQSWGGQWFVPMAGWPDVICK